RLVFPAVLARAEPRVRLVRECLFARRAHIERDAAVVEAARGPGESDRLVSGWVGGGRVHCRRAEKGERIRWYLAERREVRFVWAVDRWVGRWRAHGRRLRDHAHGEGRDCHN